jgi:PAS domain S-box-containing protein
MSSRPLTEGLRETLAVFDESGTPLATTEVADGLDLGRRSTYDRLERLVDHGRLATKKVGASARVWWRPRPRVSPARAGASVGDSGGYPGEAATAEALVGDVLDGAEVGVFVLDERFEVAWANGAVERYFGVGRERLLGRDKRELVESRVAPTVEDGESFAETVLATYEDNTYAERFECRVTAGDGRQERWLEHRSEPIESGAYAGGRVEIYYDVTERKRSERARREANERFESLVDAVEEYAIFTLDAEGRVRSWNPGAERIKGYDASEIIGEHFSAFYTEADRAAGVPEENLADARDRGSVEAEGWRVRADGSRFWANVTITPVYEDGTLAGYAKVTRDMTDRREYERRLERQRDDLEGELDDVFDRIDDAFFALDEEWRFTYVNERAEVVLDRSREELIGRSVWERFPEAVDSRFQTEYERARETGETVSFEAYYPPLARWFELTAYPSETGLSVYFRDVTERKERERELERYGTILSAIDDGVYVVDEDGRFTTVNEAYAELTGYPREELLGAPVSKVVDEGIRDRAREIERELATGECSTARLEARIETAAGERVPAEATFALLPTDDGGYERVGVVRDVTERKERERELELYEAAVETLDDGVYVVDDENRFRLVNDAHVELTGYGREELLGAHASLVTTDEAITLAEDRRDELVETGSEAATVRTELVPRDGGRTPVETRFAPFPLEGDRYGRVGVVRDVTERQERERRLETRMRQLEAIAALGQSALGDHDLDALMTEAAEAVAEALGADFCKVLDLDADAAELLLRRGVGWDEGVVGEATVPAVADDSQAAYTLRSEGPVVVEDLATERRFDGPDLLTDHDVRSGISVVVGSPDEPWGILGVHDAAVREFSDQDVSFVRSVANVLATAIDRRAYERELVRRNEQITALNTLNGVVREITGAVIDRSTREEIEATVCSRLAETDSYLFAWIGEVDAASREVRLRTEAGVEGYLDGATISADPDDERSEGPTGRALRTGEMRTARNVRTDPRYAPWRDHAEAYGFRSSAAIPITHEGTTYGVLNVYADRPDAFEGRERAVVGQLGEVVGHAIAAEERKRALMSDEVVEAEFVVREVPSALGLESGAAGTVAFDHAVPLGEGEFLLYGSATLDAVGTVESVVDALAHWGDVTFRGDDGEDDSDGAAAEGRGGEVGFEVRLSEPPVLSALASVGGSVERAVLEDDDLRMTLHLPPGVDVRQVTDIVRGSYPGAELVGRRQVTRGDGDRQGARRTLATELTDRQRVVLEAAYHAGYFEWPRGTSAEELAGSLDIASPTLHYHLRRAQAKAFDALLSFSTPPPRA